MFRYESEMIPVLISGLSRIHKNSYFTTEFSTGNGIADVVFTTGLRDQPLIFKNYSMASLFVNYISNKRRINKRQLYDNISDKRLARELFAILEGHGMVRPDNEYFVRHKSYYPHTNNLISVEAKLSDWRSGLSQALRYQFYSDKSFLALPMESIRRVDRAMLQEKNVGLIGVGDSEVVILFDPIAKKPSDLTAYYYLSEQFALSVKKKEHFSCA